MRPTRDAGLGLIAVLIAGAYFAEAASIQQSLLADAVGADGVPRMLAYGMGATGLGLVARGLLRPSAPDADAPDMRAHLRAAGLLALLIVYLVATPWLGYGLSVAALLAATAFYAGARPGLTLACTAAAGAIAFWLMFKALLGIQMPAGVLIWG